MSAEIWTYTGIGFFMGGFVLWIIVSEIRLWNYAKSILYLEGRVKYEAEQLRNAQISIGSLELRMPEKTKKGKR